MQQKKGSIPDFYVILSNDGELLFRSSRLCGSGGQLADLNVVGVDDGLTQHKAGDASGLHQILDGGLNIGEELIVALTMHQLLFLIGNNVLAVEHAGHTHQQIELIVLVLDDLADVSHAAAVVLQEIHVKRKGGVHLDLTLLGDLVGKMKFIHSLLNELCACHVGFLLSGSRFGREPLFADRLLFLPV